MAKQVRKTAKVKPITSHQLFPAVVALWFGALFGLGSIAVRPSLLEELVMKSRIDLVVPQAAPPLGLTARMLVALLMAALGSIIGVIVARRLAPPRVEVRERRRSAGSVEAETNKLRPRDGSSDAPARRPVADEPHSSAPPSHGEGAAKRRRALAIEPEEQDFVPHEEVPLPGGSPQVFRIEEANLGEALSPPTPPEFNPPPAPSPLALDWNSAPPVAQTLAGGAPQPAPAADPALEPEAAVAAAAGRQVFGLPAPVAPAEPPRQIFGQSVEDDHVSKDFVREAGYQTTVFEQPAPSPLFEPRPSATVHETAAPVSGIRTPTFAPPPPVDTAAASAELPAPQAPITQPVESLSDPAELGMTDLAARLAESMARRRAARAETAARQAEPEQSPLPPVPTPRSAAVPPAFEPPLPPAMPAPISASPAAPPADGTVPQALRPLDLSGFEEDEEGDLSSLLPPRWIAAPPPMPELGPELRVNETVAEATDEAEAPEEVAPEGDYASLIGIAPAAARSGFVRIEEPENPVGAVEPVVIFPGQAPRPAHEEAVTPFRRFDSPTSAGSGQPVEASADGPVIDPGEAERALRSALANLQRMSGAA